MTSKINQLIENDRAYEDLAIAVYEVAKADHIKALLNIERYCESHKVDSADILSGKDEKIAHAVKECRNITKFVHRDQYLPFPDTDWEKAILAAADKQHGKPLKYARRYANYEFINSL